MRIDITPLEMPPPDLAPRATGVASHLPSVLQLDQVYWIMGVCFAIVCLCQALPDRFRRPWMVELITLAAGILFALGIVGRAGAVYAAGAGVIAAALTTSFFTLLFSAATDWLRALIARVFGNASPPAFDPSIPRPTTNPEKTS